MQASSHLAARLVLQATRTIQKYKQGLVVLAYLAKMFGQTGLIKQC